MPRLLNHTHQGGEEVKLLGPLKIKDKWETVVILFYVCSMCFVSQLWMVAMKKIARVR